MYTTATVLLLCFRDKLRDVRCDMMILFYRIGQFQMIKGNWLAVERLFLSRITRVFMCVKKNMYDGFALIFLLYKKC